MDILTFFSQDQFGFGRNCLLLIDLALAFGLSSLIGFEREARLKSAGLRTHALVGLAAALLMLVSKYGFSDVLVNDHLRLDPSRIAAQIVSGIGFIGGGLIFVRKDIVHGLTTAATIWLTAGIGMACGASMHMLALVACGAYFIVVFGYTAIMNKAHGQINRLLIRYSPGHDAVTAVLATCAAKEFALLGFTADHKYTAGESASIELRLLGKTPIGALVNDLAALPAIVSVSCNPPEA